MATFESLSGGFRLDPQSQELLNKQKSLTKQINDKFIQVGAVFLKPASKHPIDEKWAQVVRGETNLQNWIDDPNQRPLNVGFTLQFGWMDCDIDSGDVDYNRCIISAMNEIGIDTRFRFGRASVGYPTHVLVQLVEEDSHNYEKLRAFEPRPIRVNNANHHTQLRSYVHDKDERNSLAKQTVVPGSVYARKDDVNKPDMSIWYNQKWRAADNITEISTTTPRSTNFTSVVRAVAYGTILYLIKDHWIEGQRQAFATKFTGWLARVVIDSQTMNEHEGINREVFCPIDSNSWAEKLVKFICGSMGDNEAHMRVRAYYDAVEKLQRNPDAKVPGWHSLGQVLGPDALQAIRSVITPGADVSNLTKMAERYVYDETDNQYIDRIRHTKHATFVHEGPELDRRHKGDVIFINGKPRETFRIFESSNIRKRVDNRDMYPDIAPGSIVRINNLGHVVSDESDEDARTVFNTWQGWAVEPVARIDPAIYEESTGYLGRLFELITGGNEKQSDWLKAWIGWIRQYPGIKQQIAPVIIGGQGIGKSFWGNTFMRAILGSRLWGTASSRIVDNDFNVGPFKNKMFMFIDEAKFTGDSSTEEIKKLIRNVDIGGMEKFQEGREYRIFSRLAFASNIFNINISQRNAYDRALFYIKATSKESMGLSESEFVTWAETLKPWFIKFTERLDDPVFVAHLVRYFVDYKCVKSDIESIKYSSSQEKDVVESNMGWARRVAKTLIESGYILEPNLSFDMPFTKHHLSMRIEEVCKELGFKNVNQEAVKSDLALTGMFGTYLSGPAKVRMLRFDKRWGDVVEAYGKAIGMTLDPYREISDDDHGTNDTTGERPIPRVQNKSNISGKY